MHVHTFHLTHDVVMNHREFVRILMPQRTKQMDYEGGVHGPFIVSWPAQLDGAKEHDGPMWSTDLLATTLDVAGIPLPKDKYNAWLDEMADPISKQENACL